MASITKKQTEKFESLANHVDETMHNAKKTHVELLKTHQYESQIKDNKCCVVMLITFALLFLSLIFINMNK
jgi:hypothetical protein